MLAMPKYKNHMRVDYACSRERHGLSSIVKKKLIILTIFFQNSVRPLLIVVFYQY